MEGRLVPNYDCFKYLFPVYADCFRRRTRFYKHIFAGKIGLCVCVDVLSRPSVGYLRKSRGEFLHFPANSCDTVGEVFFGFSQFHYGFSQYLENLTIPNPHSLLLFCPFPDLRVFVSEFRGEVEGVLTPVARIQIAMMQKEKA